MSAVVSEIVENSLADNAGLGRGDKILEINKTRLRDIIDYQIAVEDSHLEMLIERNGRQRELVLERNETTTPLGIRFESSIFDGLKSCRNNCVFCFLDQLPKGLRKNLYQRDDDFRLSFLYGNFITLTNFSDDDLDRILKQRLSPLYVSLHATDPEIRKEILRAENDKALIYLDALLKSGIEVHVQIVVCPGINDGRNLDNTLKELELRFPQVRSIGIVPVGLTRFRAKLTKLSVFGAEENRDLIGKVRIIQDRFLKKKRTSWVFLADEFYLQADEPLPSFEHYEDFPQLENGIGITRLFSHEVEEELRDVSRSLSSQSSFTVLTGQLAAPILDHIFDKIKKRIGRNFTIIGIPNRFFGDKVTVAGLITASDIIAYVKSNKLGGTLLIPEVMLNSEGLFLDDISFREMKKLIGMPIETVPVDGKQLLEKLSALDGRGG